MRVKQRPVPALFPGSDKDDVNALEQRQTEQAEQQPSEASIELSDAGLDGAAAPQWPEAATEAVDAKDDAAAGGVGTLWTVVGWWAAARINSVWFWLATMHASAPCAHV
jgi:hypothetical protein